ncbi:MAG TPA: hypothetical protein VF043_37830 [Ktedonobacteraceae bacterium]
MGFDKVIGEGLAGRSIGDGREGLKHASLRSAEASTRLRRDGWSMLINWLKPIIGPHNIHIVE